MIDTSVPGTKPECRRVRSHGGDRGVKQTKTERPSNDAVERAWPRRRASMARSHAKGGEAGAAATSRQVPPRYWIPFILILMLQLTVCYSLRPAAAKMMLVISLGCETRERWPASNSTVVACIRVARNRSRSGDMV